MSEPEATSAFDRKTVLITGATGSFGKALIDKLLADHQPTAIRCFSRDELKQSELRSGATPTTIGCASCSATFAICRASHAPARAST